MHGDLRRERARIYAEVYEQGYDPNRGSGPAIVVMVLCFVLVVAMIMLIFVGMFAAPISWVDAFFKGLAHSYP